MSKSKRRSLASFDDVANKNNDVNINVNVNDNDGNKTAVKKLNEIINVKKKEKVLTGIYFDADVLAVLDRLAEQGGRGTKTKIVNEAVKKLFQEQGLM